MTGVNDALHNNDAATSAVAPRNVVDVYDEERAEEDEEEEEEGGEVVEQDGEKGDGKGRFSLGQEHTSRSIRERREGSEWPPDHQSNCNRVVEPAHRKPEKHLIRNMFPLLTL